MIKSNHPWGKSDDAKLCELINQGKIYHKDINLAASKAIHKHWKHKTFKTIAELLRKKLKKIASGEHLDSSQGEFFVCCESQFVDHNSPFLSAQILAGEEDSSDENSQEASDNNNESESEEATESSKEEDQEEETIPTKTSTKK